MKRQLAGVGILHLSFLIPALTCRRTDWIRFRSNVNKVLEVLRDPALKAESAKEIKKEKLRLIYDRMFDDVELSRRTLARNWNTLNTPQRQEFVLAFPAGAGKGVRRQNSFLHRRENRF